METTLSIVGDQLFHRIAESLNRVEMRLRKAIAILEAAGIPFAIVGGNAVRIWVAQVDPGAVRATNDVDVLIRPEDLESAIAIMERNGYRYRHSAGLDMFLEGEDDSPRSAIHVILANRPVRQDDFEPNPDVEPNQVGDGIRTLPLERLVRMKLNSYRLKDRVHLIDMIQVGLIDATWITRFPAPLADRLQSLIENPNQ